MSKPQTMSRSSRARPPHHLCYPHCKVYAPGAKFDGADFSNGIVDRAYFKGSTFRGTLFNNCVLSGTSFEDADVKDADFTDAYIGQFDLRKLCKNPTLAGENPKTGTPTRESAGCGP